MTDTTDPPAGDSTEYLKDRFADVDEMIVAIDELDTLSSTAMSLEPIDDVDNDEIDHFRNRIVRLVELAEIGLGDIDPVLATPTLAALIDTPATALRTSIESYWVAPGPSHPNIWPQLTEFVDAVRTLLTLTGTATTTAMPQIHQQLTDTLAEAIEQAKALAERRVSYDDWHTDAYGRVSTLVSDANRQFGELREAGKKATDSAIDAAEQRFEDDRKSFVEACTQHDADADALLDRIRQQLSIASDITLSTGYAQRADKEDNTANRLRNAAVGTGAAAVLAAMLSIMWTNGQLDNADYSTWDLIPLKIVLVATLGTVAAYLGRQSERHRNFARRLRVNALELNNIGDYLSELDPGDRAEVKRELVTTFFGQHLEPGDDDSPTTGASADQLVDLLKVALKK